MEEEKETLKTKLRDGYSSLRKIKACDNRRCLVCRNPINYHDKTGRMVVLYHPECRKWRHNSRARYGK